MATSPSGGEGPARNDIYTLLIIVAAGFAWTAAITVFALTAMRFGSLLPPAGG